MRFAVCGGSSPTMVISALSRTLVLTVLRPVRNISMPKDVQARFLPASEYARAKTVDYDKMAASQKAFSDRYLKDVQ